MNDTNSESSYTDDEAPKKRRDLLTRRPSYRKILNDLGGGEIGILFSAFSKNNSHLCYHLYFNECSTRHTRFDSIS